MQEAELDALLLAEPEWVFYLTGRESAESEPFLVITENEARGLRPHETTSVGNRAGVDRAWPAYLVPEGVSVRPAFELMSDLARRKSDHELAVIERNLAHNDAAFEAVARSFAPGVTDLDVFETVMGVLSRRAGAPVSWSGNIGLGHAGDYFDAQPSGVAARPGDVMFVDLYQRIDHYVGDSTRCFAAAEAPAWALEVHERLERALAELESLLVPGAAAGELATRCRDLLVPEEVGAVFPHHTGHGVGLFGQEPPLLVEGNDDVVREGDVICVEPGLYVPGVGGLRLEDVFVVTARQPRRLTTFPRRLTIAG
jgi:Xaa-Pro aminopeptidase